MALKFNPLSGEFNIVGSGGSGGIASINTDTTSAQVIAAGTGISVSTVSGTTTISASGSSGANTALSNVNAVLASADLNPSADSAHNIGTDTNRWGIGYFATRVGVGTAYPTTGVHNTLELQSGTDGTSVTLQGYIKGSNYGNITLGTGGNWTIGGAGQTAAALGVGNSSIYINNAQVYQFNNGDVRFFLADLKIYSVGRGVQIKEGANARQGTATLVAGTVTVNNTTVTTSSRLQYSVITPGGTQGFLSAVLNAGTSFVINSTSATETSLIHWQLQEAL